MITRKDLKNKVYFDKECVRFMVDICSQDKKIGEVDFEKNLSLEWRARFLIEKDIYKDTEVYNISFVVPSKNVKLEMIAAMGMRYIQLKMKEEVAKKSEFDFTIAEMLVGMIGEPL